MKLRAASTFAFVLSLSTGGALAACSSSNDASPSTTPDAGGSTDDAGSADPAAYPAEHSPLPQVTSLGGPVLATPKVVPIFFPGFSFRTELVDFSAKLGKSAYWKAVASEYGVGELTALTAIDVADAPAAIITDADIQAWLESRFDGTHPEFGTTPVEGAIYTLFYPAATTIYLGNAPTPTPDGGADSGATDGGADSGATDGGARQPRAQASCKSFGGYHQDVKVKGVSVAYAVIPQCTKFGPLTGLDVVTGTPSHEWVEAATDPYPIGNPAYSTVDDAHLSWQFALGAGEVGDMCAQYDSSFYKDTEIGYTVQRSWSNAAATAGAEPCVPAPPGATPYFNTAPILKDDVSLAFGVTKGVTVPVGKSKTIELDLFSSAATSGPWTVEVAASGAGGGGAGTPPVSFSLDTTSGQNGDKVNLTITANAATTSRIGGSIFVITSTLGTEKHYWAGVVGN
jgi:hypothetical protein